MNDVRSHDSVITEPPFPESAQLCDELEYVSRELTLRNNHDKFFKRACLPGQPQIQLHDNRKVIAHCSDDLCTPNFDSLIDAWWSVRQYSEKLHPLSEYGVIKCEVVVTENPELHCIWDDDRIFVKAIPLYLTSYALWQYMLHSNVEGSRMLMASAIGLLRSYARLIRHPSDFALAQKAHLIPMQWEFDDFVLFLQYFAALPDSCVSARHAIEAVQLQTMNAVMYVVRRRMFHRIHRYRYNAYFTRYYGPTLFVFATFSVALSAMQVALAVRQAEAPMEEARDMPSAGFGGGLGGSWRHMGYAFRWFSIWSITFAGSMALILFSMFMFLACLDAWEARNVRREARAARKRGPR